MASRHLPSSQVCAIQFPLFPAAFLRAHLELLLFAWGSCDRASSSEQAWLVDVKQQEGVRKREKCRSEFAGIF